MRYYYSLNNQPQGPVPIEQLHELHRNGTITNDTLVVVEGGAEWKPYSTLPQPSATAASASAGGVPPVVPPQPSATPATAATPQPTPISAPAAGGGGYKSLVLISWGLIIATALLSIIPVLGCASWILFVPVFIACVVMGIVILNRGGTRDGALILIASILVLPAFTFVAPIVTTALFGTITGTSSTTSDTRTTPAATPTATARPAATPADIEDEEDAEDAENIPLGIGEGAEPAGTPLPQAKPAAGDLPDENMARFMVNNTMLNFKNAVNSGNFEPFYRTQLSDLWKKEVTPEQLRKTFGAFVERKIDLTPIFLVQPVIEPAPYVDGDGFLVLEGRYPVEKEGVNVTFKLSYTREQKWGLSGINVRILPINKQ
jgi:hypothetical protein